MDQHEYHTLFSHSGQEQSENLFHLIQHQTEYEDEDDMYGGDVCEDEE